MDFIFGVIGIHSRVLSGIVARLELGTKVYSDGIVATGLKKDNSRNRDIRLEAEQLFNERGWGHGPGLSSGQTWTTAGYILRWNQWYKEMD